MTTVDRNRAQTAPIMDVVYATIIKGLDGYPDDDTTRPMEILHKLNANVFAPVGKGGIPEAIDGITVAQLRSWATERLSA